MSMGNPMDNLVTAALAAANNQDGEEGHLTPPPAKKVRTSRSKKAVIPREKRLEQNRKAAIESRRRKKEMVDELKRSAQFYTKANTTLKAQNVELERQLLMAKQTILFNKEKAASKKPAAPLMPNTIFPIMDMSALATAFGTKSKEDIENEAMQAQFAATQALYASMGYPSAAARAAASTFSSATAQAPPPEPKATLSPPAAVNAAQKNDYMNISGNSNATAAMKPSASLTDLMSKSNAMDMSRIEELNQFAMQQAAAANAAAAAATAAIKAANFHRLMKESPKSMQMPMFLLPFASFPVFPAP